MTMKDINTTAVRYVKMHQLLTKGPVSVAQLSRSVGCTSAAARRWVYALLSVEAIEFVGFEARKAPGTGTFPSLYRWKQ